MSDDESSFDESILTEDDDDDEEEFIFVPRINKRKICKNFSFVFFLLFLESLISYICSYFLYLFEFCKLPSEFVKGCIYLMISLYCVIPIFILTDFYKYKKKISNSILFVLLSIHKIAFGLLVYDSLVFFSTKTLNFPDFESKAYWKFSMSLFYLILIFYCFFKKSPNICIYIILGVICISILILLILLTQKKSDKNEILGLYLLMTILEIIFFLIGFYYDKLSLYLYADLEKRLRITWKINRLEICRYHFIFMLYLFHAFSKIFKCCFREFRYCRLIKRNFSLS